MIIYHGLLFNIFKCLILYARLFKAWLIKPTVILKSDLRFFLSTPQPVLKTEGTVFPNKNRPRLVNDIFIFFQNLAKFSPKKCECFRAVNTARSSIN